MFKRHVITNDRCPKPQINAISSKIFTDVGDHDYSLFQFEFRQYQTQQATIAWVLIQIRQA